jgi:hypothetical protein
MLEVDGIQGQPDRHAADARALAIGIRDCGTNLGPLASQIADEGLIDAF